MTSSPVQPPKRRRFDRVVAACDLCKRRKVKCDGTQPCGYCTLKNCAATCTFNAAQARGHSQVQGHSPSTSSNHEGRDRTTNNASHALQSGYRSGSDARQPSDQNREVIAETASSLSPTISRDDHHDDTAVPLEGRILRDAQGKVIFIGDCAPLSFLQTVRYLITSEVDPEGFAVHASRDSLIEIARPTVASHQPALPVASHQVEALVDEYSAATNGLVDLFEHYELIQEMKMWVSGLTSHSDDAGAAVFFLVLAIGAQESQEEMAEAWFECARNNLMKNMCNSMNVATVQGFTLVAIFMLRASQPNGAYLYFSLAARTAYAIGLHRTEVNASFGETLKTRRDRIWKSLRVVDMLISTLLGRPPSTSDVDCTVKYTGEADQEMAMNILDSSVQIFMIIERVVLEVYSRKRISLRIADYVSRQLKGWASKWLPDLANLTSLTNESSASRSTAIGACSTLCSYYYGIMLLTRPFLIYEIYEHLGASLRGGGTQNDHRDKRKYADAALDAAASFIETLEAVILSKYMPRRMPLIVSWLFTTALVLAVGTLGRSGLVFEDSCAASIRCLDYFGENDPHARQYSEIVQSLLKITTTHVKRREHDLRLKRKQASSELFGLLPSLSKVRVEDKANEPFTRVDSEPILSQTPALNANATTAQQIDWTIYDPDFFALPWSNENDQGLRSFLQPGTLSMDGATVADIPLFPIYDQQAGSGFPQ